MVPCAFFQESHIGQIAGILQFLCFGDEAIAPDLEVVLYVLISDRDHQGKLAHSAMLRCQESGIQKGMEIDPCIKAQDQGSVANNVDIDGLGYTNGPPIVPALGAFQKDIVILWCD